MITNRSTIRVPLGKVTVTAKAQSKLSHAEIAVALASHVCGDWGDIPPEDAERNLEAMHEGSQILSVYGQGKGRFWVITSGDCSETIVLLPTEYAGRAS